MFHREREVELKIRRFEMASHADIENTLRFLTHGALGYEEVGRVLHFRKPLT